MTDITSADLLSAERPAGRRQRVRRHGLWSTRDRSIVGVLLVFPVALEALIIWLPALVSVVLSFTSWDGVSLGDIHWIGLQNYYDLFTTYPLFWPAVAHNLIWLAVFTFVAAPIGMLLAVVLDRKIAGSRFYQSAIYLPFVLSLAVVGLIWQLIYSTNDGLLNSVIGESGKIDWIGDPSLNLWAILVAACWRQIGYVMIIYLAGLKSVDPSLREAAMLDGAGPFQTFRKVIFPCCGRSTRSSLSLHLSNRCAPSTWCTSPTAGPTDLRCSRR